MAKKFNLDKVKLDQRNANKHSKRGMELLEKSVEQNGVLEAITVSADDVVISGNARTETFEQKGMTDAIIVETDGTKPVIIKRTDIKDKTPEFYRAALAANGVAKNNITIDAKVAEGICTQFEINPDDVGIKIAKVEQGSKQTLNGQVETKQPFILLLEEPTLIELTRLCEDRNHEEVAKIFIEALKK